MPPWRRGGSSDPLSREIAPSKQVTGGGPHSLGFLLLLFLSQWPQTQWGEAAHTACTLLEWELLPQCVHWGLAGPPHTDLTPGQVSSIFLG